MTKHATSYFFTFMAMALVVLLPDIAAANPIGETLCAVVGWFTGPVGGGIATLAVIIIGIGALMGKVSWGMAIIVGLGVAVVFGAQPLITALSPNQQAFCV
ncbi:MAG: TrbC/VirB2 family protein [Sphaerospermopsis sp. SIO1G2]|nr:TrbC/VirB2 family protein [Sphaerospermopsis sp. SIO1G2]